VEPRPNRHVLGKSMEGLSSFHVNIKVQLGSSRIDSVLSAGLPGRSWVGHAGRWPRPRAWAFGQLSISNVAPGNRARPLSEALRAALEAAGVIFVEMAKAQASG
jgi:hypothetical protein